MTIPKTEKKSSWQKSDQIKSNQIYLLNKKYLQIRSLSDESFSRP